MQQMIFDFDLAAIAAYPLGPVRQIKEIRVSDIDPFQLIGQSGKQLGAFRYALDI